MVEVKYINKQMAIDAINGDLPVWDWHSGFKEWRPSSISALTATKCSLLHFAIGEKPTSPPRKMIEVDGVRMPAPIWDIEDVSESFWIVFTDGSVGNMHNKSSWPNEIKNGNVYATEADAIAARDGWLQVKKQAMERAK